MKSYNLLHACMLIGASLLVVSECPSDISPSNIRSSSRESAVLSSSIVTVTSNTSIPGVEAVRIFGLCEGSANKSDSPVDTSATTSLRVTKQKKTSKQLQVNLKFKPGSKVQIVNLQKAEEYNKREGVIREFNFERYIVDILGKPILGKPDFLAVKEQNLKLVEAPTHLDTAAGTEVQAERSSSIDDVTNADCFQNRDGGFVRKWRKGDLATDDGDLSSDEATEYGNDTDDSDG